MTELFDQRRRLLAGTALAGASLALPGAMRQALAAKTLVVGVIYVGPRGDFGYNQAQAQAAAALKKMPGVKVVEEENVPETVAVAEDDGGDDQRGRRLAAVPDLVRLLRPATC